MDSEKGFSFIEVLIVLAILIVLIGISSFSYGCVVKNMEYEEARVKSSELMLLLEGIYADTGSLPVKGDGIRFSDLDKEVKEDIVGKVGSSDLGLLDSDGVEQAYIYEIDYGKLEHRGEMSEDDVSMFYVVYVDSENEDKKGIYNFNLSLITKDVIESCSGESFSILVGKSPLDGVSDGLKFEFVDDYLECPNSGLSFKLGECIEDLEDGLD